MARPRTFSKEKVLSAIRDVFWEKGYAETSYPDLEKATGLKRTSLYAAFGDKDALYYSALEAYQKEGQARIDEIFAKASDPLAGIHRLLEQSIIDATKGPQRLGCFLSNAAGERSCHCASVADFIDKNRDSVVAFFQSQVEQAMSNGEINTDRSPQQLANYIFSLYNGLMAASKMGMSLEDLQNSLQIGLSSLNN